MSRVEEALSIYHERHHTLIPIHVDHSWALMALADEYAKLRDPTPITEEWAAKVEVLKHNQYQVYMSYDRLEGRWYIQIMDDGDWSEFVGYATTCGQVRCLLLAAGIECVA